MNKHTPIKPRASLLERASEKYDFGAALRSGAGAPPPVPIPDVAAVSAAHPLPRAEVTQPVVVAKPAQAETEGASQASVTPPPVPLSPLAASQMPAPRPQSDRFAKIDRDRLRASNMIDPDGPVTGLSEEFRIVKRQLLLAARGGKGYDPVERGERILICSAHPNEGKTFCAINLALSMASEKDNRVLLVDADFAKPSVLARLGIPSSPGLMDALANPNVDVEDYVIATDIPNLSILPAGAQTNQDTEYLAASRAEAVLNKLTEHDPARIVIFDSPPALAASPASVLALQVGQTVVVVHADVTTDSALRDALSLLSGCEHIQLMLNKTKFSPTGRKFGSYYGYGA